MILISRKYVLRPVTDTKHVLPNSYKHLWLGILNCKAMRCFSRYISELFQWKYIIMLRCHDVEIHVCKAFVMYNEAIKSMVVREWNIIRCNWIQYYFTKMFDKNAHVCRTLNVSMWLFATSFIRVILIYVLYSYCIYCFMINSPVNHDTVN